MSKITTEDKVIDANKQGHPLSTEFKKGNSKKLYIECYLCQNSTDNQLVKYS